MGKNNNILLRLVKNQIEKQIGFKEKQFLRS